MLLKDKAVKIQPQKQRLKKSGAPGEESRTRVKRTGEKRWDERKREERRENRREMERRKVRWGGEGGQEGGDPKTSVN